jgi:hypothetical protein
MEKKEVTVTITCSELVAGILLRFVRKEYGANAAMDEDGPMAKEWAKVRDALKTSGMK